MLKNFRRELIFLWAFSTLFATVSETGAIESGSTGGGAAHNNMQPSLGINHLIALQGIFPSRNKAAGSDPYLGEIMMFAGNEAPRGWAFADGQLLDIAQNSALFSILGTIYGGDGRTNFALPDLRGRTPVHPGSGPGLTTRTLGQQFGDAEVTLSVENLPEHHHTFGAGQMSGTAGGDVSHSNVQPSLGINHTVTLIGLFPSRNRGSDEYIAEVNLFAGNFAPRDEALADGQLLDIASNSALFSLVGTTYGGNGETNFALPDLRGRTAVHPGSAGDATRVLGQRFGQETVALNVDNLPAHSHSIPGSMVDTSQTGANAPHENVQPSLGLNYMIALQGVFPSGKAVRSANPFIGEIGLFAGNFAPRGWALADGQLLNISQHSALFSVIGTTYGGDGETTFALPDLQGRTAVHPGSAGPGMPTWALGQVGGTDLQSLTVGQIPGHTHTVPEPTAIPIILASALLLLIRRYS